MFQDKLPPIYRSLLPDQVRQITLPEERFADCANCHHCQSVKNFRYATKCCDYHPRLPNYIVGAILSDNQPELADGRQRILNKIAARKGLTPYGIVAPMDYHRKFMANRQKKGQHSNQAELSALKCPYLAKDSRCSIYKYRSDICPVFYCMSSSGSKGSRFWNLAYQYMQKIEQKLTLYALQQQGYPTLSIKTGAIGPGVFNLEDKAENIIEQRYQKLWLEWTGKELEFYQACFDHIQRLSNKDMETLLGIEEQIQATQLAKLAKKMYKIQIPDFLQLDQNHIQYAALTKGETITLADGKQLTLNLLQRTFLKKFQGTTPTLAIVQNANLMKQQIVGHLAPLIQEGILKQV